MFVGKVLNVVFIDVSIVFVKILVYDVRGICIYLMVIVIDGVMCWFEIGSWVVFKFIVCVVLEGIVLVMLV